MTRALHATLPMVTLLAVLELTGGGDGLGVSDVRADSTLAPPGAEADSGLVPAEAGDGVGESAPADGWQAHPDQWPEQWPELVADGKAREVAAGGTVGAEPTADALQQPLSDLECENGSAGPFPCDNVDLLSFVPNTLLGGGNGNDLWGWTDPKTGHEYAIVGTGDTTAFVDISQPTDPQVVAWLPTESVGQLPLWRDIKVYRDHAFIVAEHRGHGMQIVDLTRLRDPGPVTPMILTPDHTYSEFSSAHNVAINTESGYAYVLGSDTCAGGLHMVDVRAPQDPTFAGCFASDGYTHDAQCVTYQGPDKRFRGREICFAANEDTVTIVDVTDKDNPRIVSRTAYPTAAYTHQGWLTPDHRWFLFGDELDETDDTVAATTTYIMDVTKLGDPPTPQPYAHGTDAIDHNLYIDGTLVYEANYLTGLRVLTYNEQMLTNGELSEVGFFDVVPHLDTDQFAGAWSNYPFYESGVVAVSTIEEGLFVLEPDPDLS